METSEHGKRDDLALVVFVHRTLGDSLADSLVRPGAVEQRAHTIPTFPSADDSRIPVTVRPGTACGSDNGIEMLAGCRSVDASCGVS